MTCVYCGADRDGEVPHTAEECVGRLKSHAARLAQALERIAAPGCRYPGPRPCDVTRSEAEWCDPCRARRALLSGR